MARYFLRTLLVSLVVTTGAKAARLELPIDEWGPRTHGVNSFAFSPDGECVYTGSDNTSIEVWACPSGERRGQFAGHSREVTAVALCATGQNLASGGRDNVVKIWQTSDGALIRTLVGHTKPVTSVAISPDGNLVVSGSEDKTVKMWRRNDGVLLGTLRGHTDDVISVAISHDGQWIVSGSRDQTIRVWNAADSSFMWSVSLPNESVLLRPKHQITAISISPDDRFIVAGTRHYTYWAWNVSNRRLIWSSISSVIDLPRKLGSSIVISPDGYWVAYIWPDPTTKTHTIELRRLNNGSGFCSIIVTGISTTSKVVSGIGVLLGSAPLILASRSEFESLQLRAIAFSPNGRYLLSANEEGVRVWNTADILPSTVNEFGFYPILTWAENDVEWQALGIGGRDLRLYRISDSSLVSSATLYRHTISHIAVSQDREWVATAGMDTVIVSRVSDGRPERTIKARGAVRALAISAKGERVMWSESRARGRENYVICWDIADNKVVWEVVTGTSYIKAATLSQDDALVGIGGVDGSIRLLRTIDGVESRAFAGHDKTITSLAMSQDGEWIASGSIDSTAKLWRVSDGALIRTFTGHNAPLTCITISSDGQWLLTGDQGGETRVWRTSAAEVVRSLRGYKGRVRSVAVSNNREWVVTASDADKRIEFWKVAP